MNLCKFRHKYIAVNPKKIADGMGTQYTCACQRKGCGAPAILTTWGTPISEIILYEPTQRWNGKGEIPEWAKIYVP